MKAILILLLFTSGLSFSQFTKLEVSVNLKHEYKQDLGDSLFEVCVVGNHFIKTLYLKADTIGIIDSVPNSGLYITASCLKKYGALNVVKNFNTDTTIHSTTSEIISLNIPFPAECIYDQNIKSKLCPVCNQSDKVIPIYYSVKYLEYFKKEPAVESFSGTQSSLERCSPTWYCKKDRVEF